MASGTQDLDWFVRESLAKGAGRQDIETALSSAGWPKAQATKALDAYADLPFRVPVPRPRPYLSAREAFLYLLLFATLYLSAWQLGSLLFNLVDHAFPDAVLDGYRTSRLGDSMRWSIASLLIAFPVFAWVARLLAGEVACDPAGRLSLVRRWLTYLTLFIAAAVLIGDMTVLVYNVLGGDLTLRFGLKVLVVAVIAGAIFGWYLTDLRREETPSHQETQS